MKYLVQSSATDPLLFFMVSSSDHITATSGIAAGITVKIGKNGGAGVTPSGAISEVDSTNLLGWYKVAGHSTDTNTLGQIVLHATHASCDPCDMTVAQIVAFNPYDSTALGLNGPVSANVTQIKGSVVDTTSPQLGVRLVNIGASAVDTTATQLGVRVNNFNGNAFDSTAAQVGVRVNNIVANAVDTTSPQLGVRLVNIGAAAVDTTLTQLGVRVNNINGSAVDTTATQLGVRVNNFNGNAFDSTAAQVGVRLVNIGASAVDTTAAQLGVRLVNIGASAVDTTQSQLGVRVNNIQAAPINSVADGLLDRDMSLGADTAGSTVRTPRQAFRFLRNKWTAGSGTLTVYKEDDTATSWTATITTDSTAIPIIGNDPQG